MYCIVLYCTVLYWTVLSYTVLYSSVLYCTNIIQSQRLLFITFSITEINLSRLRRIMKIWQWSNIQRLCHIRYSYLLYCSYSIVVIFLIYVCRVKWYLDYCIRSTDITVLVYWDDCIGILRLQYQMYCTAKLLCSAFENWLYPSFSVGRFPLWFIKHSWRLQWSVHYEPVWIDWTVRLSSQKIKEVMIFA